ncbi:MAG: hypothetical protein HQL80_01165 [Magnetococcales bacterium]|nr:hypothetical protein [Magnetococcales bacterium]MBF0582823.1 hypothetical protein [Magnetococcales bacterium]
MSKAKIFPVVILAGLLGVMSGCASQPQAKVDSQQEQLAKQLAAANAKADAAAQEAAKAKEENARLKKHFRKGLKK